MARYIDADKLKTRIAPESYFRHTLVWWIDLQETEDVVPVIHAHWEEIAPGGGKLYFKCSNCSTTFAPSHGLVYEYCFYCGAKMDEEVEDA